MRILRSSHHRSFQNRQRLAKQASSLRYFEHDLQRKEREDEEEQEADECIQIYQDRNSPFDDQALFIDFPNTEDTSSSRMKKIKEENDLSGEAEDNIRLDEFSSRTGQI